MGKMYKGKLALTWLLLVLFMIIPPVQAEDLDNVSNSENAANSESLEGLEAFFDGALAMQLRKYQIPGATVALVKDGEIVFSKGYGFANLQKQTPMNPETTLHRPGSNSKILVWIAVMQLVDQGRLDLYTDINTYLDFSIPTKIDGKEAPPITLHHLMTHTAGFEEEIIQLFVSGPDLVQPLAEYVKNHRPERVFQPGSVMAYSNYGTTLAAYIVEVMTGQSFGAYAEEHILAPLGMHSSTFSQPLPAHLAPQMSEGYRYEAGEFIPGGFEYVQSYPAGSLTSTTHDMARLIMALLELPQLTAPETAVAEGEEAEGEEAEAAAIAVRLLQAETAKLMQTQQFTGHPELPGMTYGLIEADYNGYRVLSHGGDTLLFTTGLYFLPTENVGLYVAYNMAVGDSARRALLHGFMDRYFPAASTSQTTPRAIMGGTEENYTGTFYSARSNFRGVESILRFLQPLRLQVDDEGYVNVTVYGESTRYGEIAPDLFRELYGTEKMAFTFDDGRVMRIHFGGPGTWLRNAWYETPQFIVNLLAISVLFMVVTILGWIRTLFQRQPRRRGFVAPKVLGVLFFLLFITVVILFLDVLNTAHPTLGIPAVALEPSSTLNVALMLTKILVGLAGLMLLTTVYMFVAAKGSRLQRLHYALLTLSSISVIAVLYQMNFF